MPCVETYEEAIQRTHDAYCKTVMRHAAITAIRRLQRKWGREISLEYLIYEKHFPITDWYDFVTAELDEERLLTACGLSAMLDNEELAAALSHLSQQDCEKIFLYYFLHQNQTQIGQRYGVSNSAIGRHLHRALRQLHEEMQVHPHE